MLKNVHLAPGWLMQLEKKLHSLQPHACFRLFLTMEINPKVRGSRAPAWPQGVSGGGGAERSRGAGPVSSSGAREPAPSGPHLRVRAAPGRQGQYAEDLQQHPRVSDMQGERCGACCWAGMQGCMDVWAPSRGQSLWVGGGVVAGILHHRTSLEAQWPRICNSAGDLGPVPGQRAKIPHASWPEN